MHKAPKCHTVQWRAKGRKKFNDREMNQPDFFVDLNKSYKYQQQRKRRVIYRLDLDGKTLFGLNCNIAEAKKNFLSDFVKCETGR